jgi:hypothetical protein
MFPCSRSAVALLRMAPILPLLANRRRGNSRSTATWPQQPAVVVFVARLAHARSEVAKAIPVIELQRRLHLRDRLQVAAHVEELPCLLPLDILNTFSRWYSRKTRCPSPKVPTFTFPSGLIPIFSNDGRSATGETIKSHLSSNEITPYRTNDRSSASATSRSRRRAAHRSCYLVWTLVVLLLQDLGRPSRGTAAASSTAHNPVT